MLCHISAWERRKELWHVRQDVGVVVGGTCGKSMAAKNPS
jgi:hypothetical protein